MAGALQADRKQVEEGVEQLHRREGEVGEVRLRVEEGEVRLRVVVVAAATL